MTSSANPYVRRVNRVVDHVRRNLDASLDLDTLAGVAGFSPFHFHRLFRSCMGETLTRFVQRARLERAAYLMMAAPKRTLTSIAHEVGFSEQSDFSRVFKQRYGIAPSRWDRTSRLSPVEPVAPTEADYAAAIAAARAEGPFPTRRANHPPVTMAYVRLPTPFFGEVLWNGYDRLCEWMAARQLSWRDSQLIGLSWDNYETTPIEQVRFDLGFVVPARTAGGGEVSIQTLPAMATVDVHCVGSLARIAAAWDYLYDEWLPSSGFEPDELPGIKRFHRQPAELGWDRYDLDCCIAIRPSRP